MRKSTLSLRAKYYQGEIMKYAVWFLLGVVGLFSFSAQAIEKVVYGVDGRKELFEVSTQYQKWAKASAAMIPNHLLSSSNLVVTLKNFSLLQNDYSLCDSELFGDQPTAANCSGFLVGPDLLVTAGHCIQTQKDCDDSSWVFDYQATSSSKFTTAFPASNVYKCHAIVSRELSRKTKMDYAVIQLDRRVTDRTPLQFRTEGSVSHSQELLVIGNPSGIPTKVTEGGSLRVNTDPIFFVANLDTFAGNSGSAVIDSKTGMVEGILVRGDTDYVRDESRGCNVVNVCAEGSCRGEDVTRITNITKFLVP